MLSNLIFSSLFLKRRVGNSESERQTAALLLTQLGYKDTDEDLTIYNAAKDEISFFKKSTVKIIESLMLSLCAIGLGITLYPGLSDDKKSIIHLVVLSVEIVTLILGNAIYFYLVATKSKRDKYMGQTQRPASEAQPLLETVNQHSDPNFNTIVPSLANPVV